MHRRTACVLDEPRPALAWLPLAAALLLTALAPRSTARADAADEARFHDEAARRHYERGRYELSLREFFLEQRLAPNPRIAFNIALCFQQLARGKAAYLDQAFLYFTEYLASSDDDADRRAAAEAAVQAMVPRLARVEVTSNPPGARIFVDKQEHGSYGATPRVLAIPAGEHRVWLELEGHREASGSVTAARGELRRVELSLPPVVGTLALTGPQGARAEVNDARGDPQASGNLPLSIELPPGPYTVRVNAEGFEPFEALASVDADQRTDLDATLSPRPPPSGGITVTSNVSGALIHLDDEPAGFSPTVIQPVTAGPHRLTISSTGLLPLTQAIEVHAGERAWVTATLEPPPETRRSVFTWIAGGTGVAALAGAAVVGVVAADTHADFESASPEDRSALRDRGRTLNAVADGLLIGGLVAFGAGAALYLLTAETVGRESSASVARGAQ